MTRDPLRDWLAAFGLFFLLVSFHGWNAYSDDEVTYIWMSHVAADEGTFAMPDSYPYFREYLVRGGDGGWYAPYPCGWPAFLSPFDAAARNASEAMVGAPTEANRAARNLLRFRLLTLVAPLLGTLLTLVAKRIFEALGDDRRTSWGKALLVLVATPAWFYARTLHVENLRTLLLLLAALAASRGTIGSAILAGAAVGASIPLRVDSPLAVPIVALLSALAAPGGSSLPARASRATIVVASAAPLWCVSFAFNFLRYGTIFGEGRYGALFAPREYLSSMWVYLLSPGRGLAIYAPLAVAGLWYGARRPAAPLARGLWFLAVAFLLLAGLFRNWVWVWDWGPRYLHLTWWAAGILALSSPEFLARRRLVAALAAWGVLMNLSAIGAEFAVHSQSVGDTLRIVLDPDAFPPLGQVRSIARGAWDLPLWSAGTWPLGLLLCAAGAGILARAVRVAPAR